MKACSFCQDHQKLSKAGDSSGGDNDDGSDGDDCKGESIGGDNGDESGDGDMAVDIVSTKM